MPPPLSRHVTPRQAQRSTCVLPTSEHPAELARGDVCRFFLIFFFLFIKCMQPKAMTLFTLDPNTSNTPVFTPKSMCLYEITFTI